MAACRFLPLTTASSRPAEGRQRGTFARRTSIDRSSAACASVAASLLPSLFVLLALSPVATAQDRGEDMGEAEMGTEETEPSVAVLFPWFAEVMGVIVFFVLTRYIPPLPYTAVMFLIGTAMGIGAVRLGNNNDHLTKSIVIWDAIDSEVLLLVFLPGLIFSDAFALNIHLLQVSLWQCVNFAFPMVLAGTCLTAIVAFYIFPYGWSWNLAMTFGSILSATDPVAVSALMNEVGAPPRLKMHISGESLLNDGSAMVFYTIFSQMFLAELGTKDVGRLFTVGEGFGLFFRMSLGGAAVGLAAGFALVFFLWALNRRLNAEENVLQVAATVTMAYLTYYVADVICKTSGVIATMTCGVIVRAFGAAMINDPDLMDSFWSLVEHLLNTLLFALGGVVWGTVIANPSGSPSFTSTDWGYLFLLYVMLHLYRFFLIFANYPITARIGLGTNWQEAVFSSFGGLRGAVGISLAIAIDNLVWTATDDPIHRDMTRTLFGMIGGVAFLTLVVNGSTAGPVLRKLGLADIPEVRRKVTDRFESRFRETMIDNLVDLLSDPRFRRVDFALVRDHVSFLADLTTEELGDAVRRQKERVPSGSYKSPDLECIAPYMDGGTKSKDPEKGADGSTWSSDFLGQAPKTGGRGLHPKLADLGASASELASLRESDAPLEETKELRSIYVEVLKYAYAEQIKNGELDVREGFVAYVLEEGLEFAADNANRGRPLNDWDMSEVVRMPLKDPANRLWQKATKKFLNPRRTSRRKRGTDPAPDSDFVALRYDVHRALAFIKAHAVAEEKFAEEFCVSSSQDLNASEKLVLLESQAETFKAKAVLEKAGDNRVKVITSHLLCQILLNKAAAYAEGLAASGLLKAQEASVYVEDVEEELIALAMCSKHKHPGQITELIGSEKRHGEGRDDEGPEQVKSATKSGAVSVEDVDLKKEGTFEDEGLEEKA